MFKTYIRLLGFAKPLSKYAVPYFFFAALHALFNTFNYAMIIPILQAMFAGGTDVYDFKPTYDAPALSFSGEALQEWLNYFYTHIFGTEWNVTNDQRYVNARLSEVCRYQQRRTALGERPRIYG